MAILGDKSGNGEVRAGIALGLDFEEEPVGVAFTTLASLGQIGDERLDPALMRAVFWTAGRGQGASNRGTCHLQLIHNPANAEALLVELADLVVAFSAVLATQVGVGPQLAGRTGAESGSARVGSPVVLGWLERRSRGDFGDYSDFDLQFLAMAFDEALQEIAQVGQQVKAIGDLNRQRGTDPSPLGVGVTQFNQSWFTERPAA